MKKEFLGVWIPKEIWENKNLTLFEKVLLVEITYLDGEKGCQATNEYFSKFFGIHPVNISKHIQKLKEKNLIWEESFDGRKRILRSKLTSIIKGTLSETTKTTLNETIKADLIKPLNIDNKLENKKVIKIDKSIQPDGCDEGSLKELDKLVGLNKAREDLKIVFTYAQAIGKNFSSNREKQSFISRNIRAARLLLGYPSKKVEIWCKILPYLGLKKWTLETVGKFIDEDPIETIMRYREKDYDDVFRELEEKGVMKWDNKEGWKLN